jgi:hypothetical protein
MWSVRRRGLGRVGRYITGCEGWGLHDNSLGLLVTLHSRSIVPSVCQTLYIPPSDIINYIYIHTPLNPWCYLVCSDHLTKSHPTISYPKMSLKKDDVDLEITEVEDTCSRPTVRRTSTASIPAGLLLTPELLEQVPILPYPLASMMPNHVLTRG